ncbi:MAG: glutathione S-transferase family protein [Hyphomicrobiales bacterium]
MARPTLIIGNKNYSSWSLRPYMALAMAGIPFDEKLIRFGEPAFGKAVRKISVAGTVPILVHNKLVISDSLAIIEYAAETWPSKNLWPKNKAARAMARSAAAEMHAGLRGIRGACPMNLRRPKVPLKAGFSDAVLKDVARIEALWAACRKAYGKGGPFLFGKWSAADAMFTPVVTRFDSYAIPVGDATRHYMNAVMATEAFNTWLSAALKEPWIEPQDEVE